MIKVKVSGKSYTIKNSWKDLDAKTLHGIRSLKPVDLICSLSDIPITLLEQLNDANLLALYGLVDFVTETPPFYETKKDIDVSAESWKKLEATKEAVKTNIAPYIAVQVAGIYFEDEVYKWPLSLVYGQTYQILESLNVFLARYSELNDGDPYDDDQLEAGVKGLETFGVGALRYSLAKGDVTKYEKIEAMNAEDVYFTLLYEKAQNEYQKRLKIIYDRQNGVST